jgi:tetratricopeptide (TPR) repeat protein
MIRQFSLWLGALRVRLLVVSLVVTGLASLALNLLAGDAEWSLAVQTVLVLVFLVIAALTVGTRLSPHGQRRMFLVIGPALGLVALGLIVPDFFPYFLGGAFGWLAISFFFIRDRSYQQYRVAVKQMRKGEYKEAIQTVSDLVEESPDNSQHYQFRAQLNRLSGKTDAAIADYQKIVDLLPDSAVGYNGLAEVYLQQGKYEEARQYAEQAFELEADYWVAPYNLGMIEDRLAESEAVIEHLNIVLKNGLPASRHRLLTYLWLARAHYRLGYEAQANSALDKLRQEKHGLHEWQTIFEDEQGMTLRRVLKKDIQLAERAIEEEIGAKAIFRGEKQQT